MFGIDLAYIASLGAVSLLAGAATGVLAGMFGVGGGTVIVPAPYELFGLYGVQDPVRMPLCVGTSLAIIAPTSISSFPGHLRKGAVEKPILKIWAGPVVVGASLAQRSPPTRHRSSSKLCIRNHMRCCDKIPVEPPKLAAGCEPSSTRPAGRLRIRHRLVSRVDGYRWRPRRQSGAHALWTADQEAVATASGVGVLVSLPGTLGYVLAGWGRGDLPPLSLGYVSLIPFALLTPVSVFATRWGVALAHTSKSAVWRSPSRSTCSSSHCASSLPLLVAEPCPQADREPPRRSVKIDR
jgi:uncharacterized protein